jgi:ubiquinone/menaquinone biosynthesis C-methylase UbiE
MSQNLKYTDHIIHYEADAEYQDYFDSDKFEKQLIRRRYEQFFHLYKIKSTDRILEIGSGKGEALQILDKNDSNYYPLDISFKNLKKISQLSAKTIYPITGDVFQLPFSDDSFHLVILSEVLEHLEDPLKALKEIKRVQLCIHCNKLTPTSAHLHSFDEKKLSRLLTEAELVPEKSLRICNKAATRLYFYILLRKTPFIIWKFFDRLFNIIYPRPSHLIIPARKK